MLYITLVCRHLFKDKHSHIHVFQLFICSSMMSTRADTPLNVAVIYIYGCVYVSRMFQISAKTSAAPKNQAVWSRRKKINNPMHRRLPIVKKWGVNKHITEWEKTLLGWLHVFSAIVVKWIFPIKCLPMEEWDYVDCHTVYLQRIHSGLVGKQPVLGCILNVGKKHKQQISGHLSACFVKTVIVFNAVPQTRGRLVGDLNRQN